MKYFLKPTGSSGAASTIYCPILAEAAPEEFLYAVEGALRKEPCPFDELFSQEGDDIITGRNYLTGLLWALEVLAWEEEYLSSGLRCAG